MHRRALISAAALAPLALPARADWGDRLQPGDAAPVRLLRSDGRLVLVRAVALGAAGMRWQGNAPVWAEDRVDLGRLGPLFRRPFARRWDEARLLGPVALAGDVLTGQGDGLAGRRVVVAAGGIAWDLPGVLGASAPVTGGEILGEARLGADGVVLIQLAGWPAL